jgi:hypothetical protein
LELWSRKVQNEKVNKHLMFVPIFSLFFSSSNASANLYGCFAWEKDGYNVPISDVKRERGLLMPALQIYDKEINLIVDKKLWGVAKHTKTTPMVEYPLFDSIDTYTYTHKNLKIEFDFIKKDGKPLLKSDGQLSVVMYLTSDRQSSMVQLSCSELKL